MANQIFLQPQKAVILKEVQVSKNKNQTANSASEFYEYTLVDPESYDIMTVFGDGKFANIEPHSLVNVTIRWKRDTVFVDGRQRTKDKLYLTDMQVVKK